MQYIGEHVKQEHMFPWAEGTHVIKAQCFFWKGGGGSLNKPYSRLLRTLLFQLFELAPDLIAQSLSSSQLAAAQSDGTYNRDWTDLELQNALELYVKHSANSFKILLLIDGMDEFEGTDDDRDKMLKTFRRISKSGCVKLCVSSRPWNVFHEAFDDCPQLRLEDLTHEDINTYVQEELGSNRRFKYLQKLDPLGAYVLIHRLLGKAEGVFLWVRLVVRELLKNLRDGSGLRELGLHLDEIPADLDDFFKHLVDSNPPAHRREALILFQIACHVEENFVAANPLRLIDLCLLDRCDENFAVSWQPGSGLLDFADKNGLLFQLDSALRKLNSRCLGLLECHYLAYETSGLLNVYHGENVFLDHASMNDEGLHPTIRRAAESGGDELFAFDFHVDFLHRSLRDFISDRGPQLFRDFAQDEFGVRNFLRNARLVQAIELDKAEISVNLIAGICSYITSTLAIPLYSNTPDSAIFADCLRPIIENIAKNPGHQHSFWYLDRCLRQWSYEGSSFLTVAIDFNLESYIQKHLTRDAIRFKAQRPILDYVLRPRFVAIEMAIGNQSPPMHLLKTVLINGGDPNQPWEGSSVWALFLSFISDFANDIQDSPAKKEQFLAALALLIRYGAASDLPRSWIAEPSFYKTWGGLRDPTDQDADKVFDTRWGSPAPGTFTQAKGETFYSVRWLLGRFKPVFGAFHVRNLQELLDNRDNLERRQTVAGAEAD